MPKRPSFIHEAKKFISECERKISTIEPWNHELLKSLRNEDATSRQLQVNIASYESELDKFGDELSYVRQLIHGYVKENKVTRKEYMKDEFLKLLLNRRKELESTVLNLENQINDSRRRHDERALWITSETILKLEKKLKQEKQLMEKGARELGECDKLVKLLRSKKDTDEKELLDLECTRESLRYHYECAEESAKYLEMKKKLLIKQEEELSKNSVSLSVTEVIKSTDRKLSDLEDQFTEESLKILENQLKSAKRHEQAMKKLRKECAEKLILLSESRIESGEDIGSIKQKVNDTLEQAMSSKNYTEAVQSDIVVNTILLECDAKTVTLAKRKEILHDEIAYLNEALNIKVKESPEELVPKLIKHNEDHKRFTRRKTEILRILHETKRLQELPRNIQQNNSDANAQFLNSLTNTACTAKLTPLFLNKRCAPDVIPEKPAQGKQIKLKFSYHDRQTFNVAKFLSAKLSVKSDGTLSTEPSPLPQMLPGISYIIMINLICGNVHFDPSTIHESAQFDNSDPLFKKNFIPMLPFIPNTDMNSAFQHDSPTLIELLQQNKTYRIKIPVTLQQTRRPVIRTLEINIFNIVKASVRNNIHERTNSAAILKTMYTFQSDLCKCNCHPWNNIQTKQLHANQVDALVKLKSLQLTLTPINNLEELRLLNRLQEQSLDIKRCINNPVQALCETTPSTQESKKIRSRNNNFIWLCENISSATTVDHRNRKVRDSMLYRLTCCDPMDSTLDMSSVDFDSERNQTDNNLLILSSYVSTAHTNSSDRMRRILNNFGIHYGKELILATSISSPKEFHSRMRTVSENIQNEFTLIKVQLCRTHAYLKDKIEQTERQRAPIKRLFKKVTQLKQLRSQLEGLENFIHQMDERYKLLETLSKKVDMKYNSYGFVGEECVNQLIELMDSDNNSKLRADTLSKTSGGDHRRNTTTHPHAQKSREIHFHNSDGSDDMKTLSWEEVLGDDHHDLPSNLIHDPDVRYLRMRRKKDLDLS